MSMSKNLTKQDENLEKNICNSLKNIKCTVQYNAFAITYMMTEFMACDKIFDAFNGIVSRSNRINYLVANVFISFINFFKNTIFLTTFLIRIILKLQQKDEKCQTFYEL